MHDLDMDVHAGDRRPGRRAGKSDVAVDPPPFRNRGVRIVAVTDHLIRTERSTNGAHLFPQQQEISQHRHIVSLFDQIADDDRRQLGCGALASVEQSHMTARRPRQVYQPRRRQRCAQRYLYLREVFVRCVDRISARGSSAAARPLPPSDQQPHHDHRCDGPAPLGSTEKCHPHGRAPSTGFLLLVCLFGPTFPRPSPHTTRTQRWHCSGTIASRQLPKPSIFRTPRNSLIRNGEPPHIDTELPRDPGSRRLPYLLQNAHLVTVVP